MPSKVRLQRIADRFRQDLSVILLKEISDPRLSGVYVNYVKVDRELAYADIYVSAIEGIDRKGEILEGFEHATGFLRRRLSEEIELRTFPKLRFYWDSHPEKVEQLEKVFAEMKKVEAEKQKNGDSE